MGLELIIRQTDDDIATYKRGELRQYFDCPVCGKRAYTSVKNIEAHVETCDR